MEHDHADLNPMAAAATLHCLTGCAIGEIGGLIIGAAAGLGTVTTTVASVVLAFFFGYLLSTLPLLNSGLALRRALTVVLAADALSILAMEVSDNAVVALVPGAMAAELGDAVFWASMIGSLLVAFAVAFPVNRYLLARGKGHALTHGYHGARGRWPDPSAPVLAAVLGAFMVGGLLAALGS